VTIRLNKNWRCRTRIRKLVALYSPDAVVLETPEHSLRHKRVRQLLKNIAADMGKQGIPVHQYSREQVLDVFASFSVRSKHAIARKIAEWFPDLDTMLPTRQRKFYEPEDERYGMFDAAALVLVHLYLTK